jgi:Ulp1 protease family, C-terminal catalytic domain
MDTPNITHIKSAGDVLVNSPSTKLAMIVFVQVLQNGTTTLPIESEGDHWVSVIIDAETNTLMYGNPLHYPPPPELVNMLRWWLKHYLNEEFTLTDLPCAQQQDGYSCGVLAVNGLAHHFFPESIPLIAPDACDAGRVNAWARIIRFLKATVMLCSLTFPSCILTQSNQTNLQSTTSHVAPQPFEMTVPAVTQLPIQPAPTKRARTTNQLEIFEKAANDESEPLTKRLKNQHIKLEKGKGKVKSSVHNGQMTSLNNSQLTRLLRLRCHF